MQRRLICSIVGRRVVPLKEELNQFKLARQAALCAVEAGFTVMTGGREGTMVEAAYAAKQAGGNTIAVLPSNSHAEAFGEAYDYVLPTPIGIVRNVLTASMCDVMIALPGGSGTIEEILFAQDFGRPVVLFTHWLSINQLHVPYVLDSGKLLEWLNNKRESIRGS